MSKNDPAISLQGVSRIFHAQRGDVVALADVELDIQDGEFITMVGPSGCGKSTALNLVAGLLEPSGGNVLFRGSPTSGINREIGYVTQSDNLFPWRTVIENVMFGMEMRGIGTKEERRDKALALLDRVNLTGFQDHYRHELSGGMRQRVNIVRTLAYDPKVLLLDEPFGPLDAQTRLQLQDLLLKLWHEREGITVIFITHELNEAIALADRVVVMSARPGRVREVVPVDIPRPRDIYSIHSDPSFRDIYDQIWKHLGEEMKESSL
ncbi:MAG: ABC transporter ATP-binding protein [Nitrospinota bacterium]|nr:ABC transporter ATP-binding protein [Nitrospinota bacterium]